MAKYQPAHKKAQSKLNLAKPAVTMAVTASLALSPVLQTAAFAESGTDANDDVKAEQKQASKEEIAAAKADVEKARRPTTRLRLTSRRPRRPTTRLRLPRPRLRPATRRPRTPLRTLRLPRRRPRTSSTPPRTLWPMPRRLTRTPRTPPTHSVLSTTSSTTRPSMLVRMRTTQRPHGPRLQVRRPRRRPI